MNQLVNLLKCSLGSIVDGLLDSSNFFTIKNSCEHFSFCLCGEHMYAFLLGIYLVVKLLHHQLATYSAIADTDEKCSKVVVPIYSPSVSV